jgi:hypothetical protein
MPSLALQACVRILLAGVIPNNDRVRGPVTAFASAGWLFGLNDLPPGMAVGRRAAKFALLKAVVGPGDDGAHVVTVMIPCEDSCGHRPRLQKTSTRSPPGGI